MIEDIFKNMSFFKNFLSSINDGGRIFSYLIVSKDAYSANTVAKLMAQALLCHNMCGTCENCKKVLVHSHPDVKVFPEKDRLVVEDSKKIVDESYAKPIMADKKVIIIKNIEEATEEAQNKLLKSLEEPNKNVYYLLTCSFEEKILPTIKSRCFKVEIPFINSAEILPLLKGQNKELAIAIGNGFLAKTIELDKNEQLVDITHLAVSLITELNSSKQAVVWSKRLLEQKQNFQLILEIFGLILEDALSLKINKQANIHLNSLFKEILFIARDFSIKCLTGLAGLIIDVMKELTYNVNLSLVVDNFIMNILEVKYLCK